MAQLLPIGANDSIERNESNCYRCNPITDAGGRARAVKSLFLNDFEETPFPTKIRDIRTHERTSRLELEPG